MEQVANLFLIAKIISICNGLFTTLAVLIVVVRLCVRTVLNRKQRFGWDDGLITVAALGSIVHAVRVADALRYGYGYHLWNLRSLSFTPRRMSVLTTLDPIYVLTVFLVKLSILLLYRRLFSIYSTSKKLILVGIFLVILTTIPGFGLAIARFSRCNDNLGLHTPLCHNRNISILFPILSACNTLTNLLILIIPIRPNLVLSNDKNKIFGLRVIFLAGFCACIMSVVRLTMVSLDFNKPDTLWRSFRITPFTVIEMNLGIICSCMMFIPAFVKSAQGIARTLTSSYRRNGSIWAALRDCLKESQEGSGVYASLKESLEDEEMEEFEARGGVFDCSTTFGTLAQVDSPEEEFQKHLP